MALLLVGAAAVAKSFAKPKEEEPNPITEPEPTGPKRSSNVLAGKDLQQLKGEAKAAFREVVAQSKAVVEQGKAAVTQSRAYGEKTIVDVKKRGTDVAKKIEGSIPPSLTGKMGGKAQNATTTWTDQPTPTQQETTSNPSSTSIATNHEVNDRPVQANHHTSPLPPQSHSHSQQAAKPPASTGDDDGRASFQAHSNQYPPQVSHAPELGYNFASAQYLSGVGGFVPPGHQGQYPPPPPYQTFAPNSDISRHPSYHHTPNHHHTPHHHHHPSSAPPHLQYTQPQSQNQWTAHQISSASSTNSPYPPAASLIIDQTPSTISPYPAATSQVVTQTPPYIRPAQGEAASYYNST